MTDRVVGHKSEVSLRTTALFRETWAGRLGFGGLKQVV